MDLKEMGFEGEKWIEVIADDLGRAAARLKVATGDEKYPPPLPR
jgi:hypothetical protein